MGLLGLDMKNHKFRSHSIIIRLVHHYRCNYRFVSCTLDILDHCTGTHEDNLVCQNMIRRADVSCADSNDLFPESSPGQEPQIVIYGRALDKIKVSKVGLADIGSFSCDG